MKHGQNDTGRAHADVPVSAEASLRRTPPLRLPNSRGADAALQTRIDQLEAQLAATPPTADAHVDATRVELATLVAELDRRRREAEETCEMLTGALDASSDGFVTLDSEWRYTYVSEHAGRILGRDPESLVRKHIWTEFPDAVRQPVHAVYERAAAEHRPQQVEVYHPPLERWLEHRVFPHAGGVAIFFQDVTDRRTAQARLRESESRFRALFEHAAIGIALVDMDGRFVRANPAFCQMLGYEERELQGLETVDVTHPDDRAAQAEHTARVLAGEAGSSSLEKRYVRRDGSMVWSRITISVMRDDGSAAHHYVVIAEDVSERVRVEAALRESEARYDRITANVPGVVYQFIRYPDGSFDLSYVSAGAREIAGLAPEDIQREPLSFINLVHPDDRVSWNRSVAASAATLSDWHWTGRVVVPAGEVKWIEGVARPERQPDGRIVWDGLVVDVTERRRAEQEHEESEQRYRSLFDQHPDAVFVIDPDGLFVSVNPACEDLSGYNPNELIGQPFAPLLAFDDRDESMAHFRQALKGTATSFDTAIRHKTGRRVDIGVTNIPMVVGGQITGVFGIARDLTAQRELEAQLRHAQRMEAVGRLAGGVAHDFNNLLTVIQSCSQFVAERVRDDEVARADVEQVLNATSRAAELTKQLLAFGRRQLLQPRLLDVNVQVMKVAGMLRRVIGEDITIATDLEPELWPTLADPGQLEQVLMNLAVNSRDAMPNGGTLRLGTANVMIDRVAAQAHPGLVTGPYVSLAVEDTGTGIDPAILSNIFDPFVTTKGPGMGTGLGLATVYGIVEQSGGHIYAESTPGIGSRFTVLIPRADVAAAGGAAAGNAPALPRGSETVLLVEDDALVRAVVRRMLEAQGYEVTEAANGDEAIRTVDARNGQFDLLLLDVVMPGMNGRALAEQLSVRWPGLRVIFMSGYTDDEMLRRGLVQPGLSFLAKPFTPDHLARAVREALDAPRPT